MSLWVDYIKERFDARFLAASVQWQLYNTDEELEGA